MAHSLAKRAGDCRFAFIWLIGAEVSTLFLNLKALMSIAGYKGVWYLVNGITFFFVFTVSRIGLYGAGLWHMWQTRCERHRAEAHHALLRRVPRLGASRAGRRSGG